MGMSHIEAYGLCQTVVTHADIALQNWIRNPPAFASFERNIDNSCFRESLGQEQMAVMSRFARFPSVSVETTGNVCTVWLRDLRYARKNTEGWGVARAEVPLPKPRSQ
jgi:hypothetical protein